MKKVLLLIVATTMLLSCNKKTTQTPLVNTTYDVEFDVDYNDCGIDPLVSKGGVDFGNTNSVKSGMTSITAAMEGKPYPVGTPIPTNK